MVQAKDVTVRPVNTNSCTPARSTSTAATYSSRRMPGTSGLTTVLRATGLPPRGGLRGHAVQAAVHQRDGDRALADGGRDPLDRAVPHVAHGEHPRQAGLQQQWRPV